jgi:predicted XRE-type DNA-binding protein
MVAMGRERIQALIKKLKLNQRNIIQVLHMQTGRY